MISIKAHISNVALHHTIFDLPFAFMGAVIAAGGTPRLYDLFWIMLAITTGRAAALAIDNLADLKFDRQQPRMQERAMVRGIISKREALIFIIICLALMILSVAKLQPICLYLLPLAAFPFIIYPFTKRFTGWCHMVLGIAIAMAPAGGYVGVAGTVTYPMILLCIAVALWICAFDAMYGAQDEEFDKKMGLHSLAETYGGKNAFKLAKIMHILCIVCFFALGCMLGLGYPYFIGVGIAGGVLVYQHQIVSPTDFSRVTQRYFMRNGIVSVAIFICTWLSYLA